MKEYINVIFCLFQTFDFCHAGVQLLRNVVERMDLYACYKSGTHSIGLFCKITIFLDVIT